MGKLIFLAILAVLIILISGCVQKECEAQKDCLDRDCFARKCAQSKCFYSQKIPCCGDRKCEPGEVDEKCQDDCPNCDDRNNCTEDSFDYETQRCINEKTLPCCGSGECEAGETYETCSQDCVKSGFLEDSEIWGGEILITGDINSNPDGNATLTLLPGTRVVFTAHKDDQNSGRAKYDWFGEERGDTTITEEYSKTHIEVNARIIAHGTRDKPIIFSSDAKNKTHYDWEHLSLYDGSILNHTIIEHARAGANTHGDNITIANSIIRHVLWGCIGAGSSAPLIINCTF